MADSAISGCWCWITMVLLSLGWPDKCESLQIVYIYISPIFFHNYNDHTAGLISANRIIVTQHWFKWQIIGWLVMRFLLNVCCLFLVLFLLWVLVTSVMLGPERVGHRSGCFHRVSQRGESPSRSKDFYRIHLEFSINFKLKAQINTNKHANWNLNAHCTYGMFQIGQTVFFVFL